MNQHHEWHITKDNVIHFAPYHGEFGWEVATIAPYYRYISKSYNKAIVTSFPGMKPLYEDFATFWSHGSKNRTLNYPKRYRLGEEAIYKKYGKKRDFFTDIVIHNRGIKRKNSINFTHWNKIINYFKKDYHFATIGTFDDKLVENTIDLRNFHLQNLMNLMASCKCVVGVSSGVMHLAAFCGANIVVWGDNRTYYHETLEKRYKETWNPFHNKVHYITCRDFKPQPKEIIEGIEQFV